MIENPLPQCPKCSSIYVYECEDLYLCPECVHEWPIAGNEAAADEVGDDADVVKDASGTILKDGDDVTVIKDLKVKGSSLVVKVGTKVRNIRLTSGDHNIDCKIKNIGKMELKSEFVRKV